MKKKYLYIAIGILFLSTVVFINLYLIERTHSNFLSTELDFCIDDYNKLQNYSINQFQKLQSNMTATIEVLGASSKLYMLYSDI